MLIREGLGRKGSAPLFLCVGGVAVMASISSAWVSSFTGLPSFRVSGPGEVRTTDGRLIARSVLSDWRCSDVFAPVGIPQKYTVGGAAKTLTRAPFGTYGTVLVADLSGRGVVVDFFENIGDPYKFKSGGSRAKNGRVRANPRGDVRTGECRLVLDGPGKREALDSVLESPGRKFITLDRPALGVPDVRCVWVTDVDRTRTSHWGEFEYRVKYELQDAEIAAGAEAVPSLTFGEVASTGLLWGANKTFGEVCALGGGS